MSSGNAEITVGGVAVIAVALVLLTVLVHVLLAIGVYHDVETRRRSDCEVRFGGPWTWAGATLLMGLVGLGAYWAIHYSIFAATSGPPEIRA
ncbi:MAG: hypothetical protein HY812_13750 [Planctomycetes bacterium]|nr:hypothetical protein [Planctomycetota bacterium]